MKRWLIAFAVVLASAFVIGVVAFGLAMYGAISTGAPAVTEKSVLVVDLSGPVAEYAEYDAAADVTLESFCRVMRMAAVDDRVDAVRLDVGVVEAGFATAQEMRSAVASVAATDKPVIAYIEQTGNMGYFVASGCDEVIVHPGGFVNLVGLSAQPLFVSELLENVGIAAEFEKIEEYKSVPEMFTRSSLSEPARRQLEDLLDDLFYDLTDGIANSRGLSGEQVESLIDQGPFMPDQAVAAGLADRVAYGDEVDAYLDSTLGEGWAELAFEDYVRQDEEEVVGRSDHTIAVVYAVGAIESGESGSDLIMGKTLGSRTFTDMIEEIAEDDDVEAVVVRVVSPGGSGLASDVIWRSLQVLNEDKPVVVSMGDVAASGGYYVSCGADVIVAKSGTITGSIGVYAGKFVTRELQEDIGLTREILDRGKHASAWSEYRPFTDEERGRLREEIRKTYDDFVAKVAAGRGMDEGRVDSVGRGRVWSGSRALSIGLVDELGGLDQAVRVAKDKAGIPQAETVRRDVYPRPEPWWKRFLAMRGASSFAERAYESLQRLQRIRVFAMMPYFVSVK